MLEHMFHLSVPIAEKLIRPAIIYFVLIGLLRIFGKRELAQLNPFDLVVLLSLSNVVQNSLIGDDNSVTGGIIGAFTLLGVNWLTVRLLYRNPKLDELLEGAPRTLIAQGQVQHRALRKEVLSLSELRNAAHRQGFETLEEIERCVLEPGGTFTFYRKQPTEDALHYQTILARLDQLSRELQALKNA